MRCIAAQYPCDVSFVAADERSEAAIGGEAVVNQATSSCQVKAVFWFYDGFAAERSLAPLVSCYEGLGKRSGRDQIHRLPMLMPAIARNTGQL